MDCENYSSFTSRIKVEANTDENDSIDVEYTLIKEEIDDDRLKPSFIEKFPIEKETSFKNLNGEQSSCEPIKLRKTIPALCTLCNTGFPDTDAYEEHLATAHKSELPYQCRFCPMRFKSNGTRSTHEKIHDESRFSGPAKYKCDMCDKTYHIKGSLTTHKRFLHRGYPRAKYEPVIKPVRQLHSKNGVKNPNAGRKTPETHPCSVCGRIFPWKSALEYHITSHSDGKPFSCEHCGETFKWQKSLDQHVKRSHKPGVTQKKRPKWEIEQSRRCKICGKTYPSLYKLVIHMRSHTGERPFKCDICGESFRSNPDRSRHIVSRHAPQDDTGLRTWSCRICGKSGIKAFMTLKTHVLVTHGFDASVDRNIIKAFACGVCGKPYHLGIQAVICAILSHNPEKLQEKMFRYKCPKCPNDFGYHNLPYFRKHWESRHSGLDPPKEFRLADSYKTAKPEDIPISTVDKRRSNQLRWGAGVPPEVAKSDFSLYTRLELLPHLHQKKKKKYCRKQGDKEECELCGISVFAFNMDRHLQSCKGQGAEKKTNTEGSRENSSKVAVNKTVKVSDVKEINKILNNHFVTVSVSRICY